jgi:hypothetical protein
MLAECLAERQTMLTRPGGARYHSLEWCEQQTGYGQIALVMA